MSICVSLAARHGKEKIALASCLAMGGKAGSGLTAACLALTKALMLARVLP
jgi:hypothetical protein